MFFYFIILLIISIINISPQTTKCIENQNNCIRCNPLTNICTKCTLDIYFPDDNGGCSPISKCFLGRNYCSNCDEDGVKCNQCETGFYPDENGGCSYVDNCEISYKGNCLKCKKDFILVGSRICKYLFLEDFSNCEIINNETGFCEKCQEGYFKNLGDNKCTLIEHCYQSSFGICTACNNDYYLDIIERKCKKIQNDSLLFCKESLDGKYCDVCKEDYFHDENGNCININYCSERKGTLCGKCIDGYYLTTNKDSCTNDPNCSLGDKFHGLCNSCNVNYYLDLTDRKCKLNKEDMNYIFCSKVEKGYCQSCNYGYNLSKDGKCTITKNCAEVENGICLSCLDKYYLGLDNRCSNVEKCIYSETYADNECRECEDGYYYNVKNKTCLKYKEGYENCRITSYNGEYCSFCKNNYYINATNHLCYSNQDKNLFYKCILTDSSGTFCIKCEDGYHVGVKDNKCNNIAHCDISEDGEKCIECDRRYTLNEETGQCELNS